MTPTDQATNDEPEKESKRTSDNSKQATGIDNRNESARRYGNLEPEGYTRHSHGDREGEFQKGAKSSPELPVEESAPMRDVRYRKDEERNPVTPDQYGGRTYDSHAGDRDISGVPRRKPPRVVPPRR